MDIACNPTAPAGNGQGLSDAGAHGTNDDCTMQGLTSDGKRNRNTKVTLEAWLGLIGGTMGLLTGFSILSGVEILYFLIKLTVSLLHFRD